MALPLAEPRLSGTAHTRKRHRRQYTAIWRLKLPPHLRNVFLVNEIIGRRMTDLNSLVIFAKVVEAGGFSEAARRLNIPVSTVSRRIADLERDLGVQLLERSTRNLRVTDIGAEVLDQARRTIEVSESVEGVVSNHLREVTGTLRLSGPPSISDSLMAPLIGAFQIAYPQVRVHVFVSERYVDLISEGIDLVFRVDPIPTAQEVTRPVLRYRHQLVASPEYLARISEPLKTPRDLLNHRLLAFSHGEVDYEWNMVHADGTRHETITFRPHLAMNDFYGLSTALMDSVGVGDLPPIVRPDLVREGRLVEVMPDWHFPTWDLSLAHVANRYVARPVRLFIEMAQSMAPSLFPVLPV